jgi:hypothetical protein
MNGLKRYRDGAAALAMIALGAVAIPADYAAAEENAAEAAPVESEQHTGTVDALYDDRLVINDSSIPLNSSILLYNEGGGRMSANEFRVGDAVAVTVVKDEAASKRKVVSITRTKGASGEAHSSGQQTEQSGQRIKQVDGVWINY